MIPETEDTLATLDEPSTDMHAAEPDMSLDVILDVPVTLSLVTTLKLVKSAMTCSSARTSMFWKFRLSFSPLKPGPCTSLFGSTFIGRTSSTNWLSVW